MKYNILTRYSKLKKHNADELARKIGQTYGWVFMPVDQCYVSLSRDIPFCLFDSKKYEVTITSNIYKKNSSDHSCVQKNSGDLWKIEQKIISVLLHIFLSHNVFLTLSTYRQIDTSTTFDS